MKPTIGLKIGHQLTMTPQLQQAIRLLQMSSVDLRTEILSALEANPLLEIKEEDFSDTSIEDSLDDHNEDRLDDELSLIPQEREWGRAHHELSSNPIESLNAVELTLRDHLFLQMQLTPFSDTDRLIAATIIDAINEDGFLTSSLEDIAATLMPNIEVDIAEIEAVLHRIQQFDPIGVGSRTLEECLSVQIKHLPLATPWHHQAQMLITHYLLLLGKHDYATLRRRLGLSSEELQEVIHLIQTLNPRPGTQIGQRAAEYIIPDAMVYKKQGKWIVELNSQSTPDVTINDYYASLIRQKDPNHNNQSLRQQLQEARWFLKSIEARNTTLLKVVKCIVSHQIDFLEHGPEHMKPLILQDVANDIDMHESTISRITTQKYLRTPRGIFELKYFFSSHINKEQGNDCSPTAVRALIKKLIVNENAQKPLSDSKIAVLLAQQGIALARRTVAKYREEMNILPSHERKQLI